MICNFIVHNVGVFLVHASSCEGKALYCVCSSNTLRALVHEHSDSEYININVP